MNMAAHMLGLEPLLGGTGAMLLCMRLDGQAFGIPVQDVRQVRAGASISRIPLAPPGVAGAVSLNGRVVTVMDLRQRLGLPPASGDAAHMLVIVERGGEYYGLKVDAVADVLAVPADRIRKTPSSLGPAWRLVAVGTHDTPAGPLAVADVDALLALDNHYGRR